MSNQKILEELKSLPKLLEREYRTHPAISRSDLWRMKDTPEKFKWYMDHPDPATPSLLFGQVVHKLILEPDDFNSDFVVAPIVDKRTKAGKEEWERFTAESADKTVVGFDMFHEASEMANAVLKYQPAASLIINGAHEVPFFWTDNDTGESCKCRVDCLTELDGEFAIIDYKTAADASTDAFNKAIYKYGYHFQSAMYSEGVKTCLELSYRPRFIFIVQEKKPPYAINVVDIPSDVMLYGMDIYREFLGTYHECKETGWWYGYMGPFNEMNEAYLPSWLSLGESDGDDE